MSKEHPFKKYGYYFLNLLGQEFGSNAISQILKGKAKTPDEVIEFAASLRGISPLSLESEIRNWEKEHNVEDEIIL